jgi:hypothetical protein
MPTVKLQNGKVILKDGKVSCTCCDGPEPGECCLYPASGLGDTYEAADLPDAVTIGGRNFTRSGSVFYEDDGPALIEEMGGGNWVLQDFDGDEEGGDYFGICLIGEYDGPTVGLVVEDQFADCYEVSNPGNGNDVAAGTVQVFRVSLCRWESANFNDGPISNALRASLEYLSGGEFEDDPRGDLWSAFSGTLQAESPAGGVKESLSSPLGTYEGDFLPNVTVSPCF